MKTSRIHSPHSEPRPDERNTGIGPRARSRSMRHPVLRSVVLLVVVATAIGFVAPFAHEAEAAVPLYIRINFQRPESITPAGFLDDHGLPYGQRVNGLVYGWDRAIVEDGRDRGDPLSYNQPYDTLMHMQKGAPVTWELELADGSYYVRVVCGDPTYTDSRFHTLVENQSIVNQSAGGGSAHWRQGERLITVSDGRLTVRNGNQASNNKICFLEISDAPLPPVDQTPDAPPTPQYDNFELHVNFQPYFAEWPEGYQLDDGATYNQRGNGFTYGWNTNHGPIERNSPTSPDQRYDTLIPMGGNSRWEVEVPNGEYYVRIVAGDPSAWSGHRYRIEVEGRRVVNGSPNSNRRWIEGDDEIRVTDGRLTVETDNGARENRICFIDVVSTAITSFGNEKPKKPKGSDENALMDAARAMLANSVVFRSNGATYLETVDSPGGAFVDPRTYAATFYNVMTRNGSRNDVFDDPTLIEDTIDIPDESTGASPGQTIRLDVIVAVGGDGAITVDGRGLDANAIVFAFGRSFTGTGSDAGRTGGHATIYTRSGQLGIAVAGFGESSSQDGGAGGNATINGEGRGFALSGQGASAGSNGGRGGNASVLSARSGIAFAHDGGSASVGGNGGEAIVHNGPAALITPEGRQGVAYAIGGSGANGSVAGSGGPATYIGMQGYAAGGAGGDGTLAGNGGWADARGAESTALGGPGGSGNQAGRGGDANAWGQNVTALGGQGGNGSSLGGDGGNAFAFGSANNNPSPFYSITAAGGNGGSGGSRGGNGGDGYALANSGFALAYGGFGGNAGSRGGDGGDATASANHGDAQAIAGNGGSPNGPGGAAVATAPNGSAVAINGSRG